MVAPRLFVKQLEPIRGEKTDLKENNAVSQGCQAISPMTSGGLSLKTCVVKMDFQSFLGWVGLGWNSLWGLIQEREKETLLLRPYTPHPPLPKDIGWDLART